MPSPLQARPRVVGLEDTHKRAVRAGNRVLASSADSGWGCMHATLMEEAPFDAAEQGVRHPSFIYHVSRPTEVTRRIDGCRQEKTLIGPRRITLTPGRPSASWSHQGNPEILQVYLHHDLFASAVSAMFECDPAKADIVPRFAILDPLLEQLSLAVISALRDTRPRDSLYVESLAQMIAAHLARAHSSFSDRRIGAAPQISSWKMRRLKEFIEANLDRDLSLATLAREAGVSSLYLPRAFRNAFGQSPHQYVIGRRIERARYLLQIGELTVAEVSAAAGFSSQSHLSHWFSRTVGVTPAAYRRNNPA